MVKFVVCLREARDHAQAHRAVLIEFGGGFFLRDGAAQRTLARRRQFLGERHSHIGDRLPPKAIDRIRPSHRRVADRDRGIRQAALLRGPLTGSLVSLLGGENLTIAAQRFFDERGQRLCPQPCGEQ